MDDVPPPFAGWLEEHPDGGFIILCRGEMSDPLTSYEAAADYFEAREIVPGDDVTVIRMRHVQVVNDGDEIALPEPKLYPPEPFVAREWHEEGES
jgi:hypothetical protein